jgi:hypothetical protein
VSHHYSGPDFGFPHHDARLDLTDLFAFPKAGGGGKSILIMDVHPSTNLALQPTTRVPFAEDGLYEIKIDTDGDNVANIAFRVRFSPAAGGNQTARLAAPRVRRPQGPAWGGRSLSTERQYPWVRRHR